MNLDSIKKMAGIVQDPDLQLLDEAVEIPANCTIEDVQKMMDAAKRALSLANKLKDPADKKKHISQVMSGMNKIRAALKKCIDNTK